MQKNSRIDLRYSSEGKRHSGRARLPQCSASAWSPSSHPEAACSAPHLHEGSVLPLRPRLPSSWAFLGTQHDLGSTIKSNSSNILTPQLIPTERFFHFFFCCLLQGWYYLQNSPWEKSIITLIWNVFPKSSSAQWVGAFCVLVMWREIAFNFYLHLLTKRVICK